MTHERFDFDKWKSVFSLTGGIEGQPNTWLRKLIARLARKLPTVPIGGEIITSPYDIVMVETIRNRVLKGRNVGIPVPTDVCIMARGEPVNRAVTKIGGLPYWPLDRPWPSRTDGNPLTFVAQFNFVDSMDITGPLPGDLLVIFADSEAECGYIEGSETHLAWFSLDQRFTLVEHAPETDWPIDPCYATLYRTVDYPDVDSDIFEAYSSPYLFPCLEGTKVGGAPRWIQNAEPMPGRFLGTLGSVQPAYEQPYPFLNVPDPITTYNELFGGHYLMIGDMGSYYLFLDDEGQVTITGQCY